jgi:hypothetical protein
LDAQAQLAVEQLRRIEKRVAVQTAQPSELGAGEMITEDLPGSPAYERARAMWGARVASSEAGESVLERLVIRDLPYKVYKVVGSVIASAARETALTNEMRTELGLRKKELIRAFATMDEQEQRAALLEQTAAERLAAMHDKDRRAALLEQAAAERLAAMNDKDQASSQLRAELEVLRQQNRQLEEERLFAYLGRRLSRRGAESR